MTDPVEVLIRVDTSQWPSAEDLEAKEDKSLALWSSDVLEDRRTVLLLMVQDTLQQLHDQVSEWVPRCLEPTSDDALFDVRILFQLEPLDEAGVRETIGNLREHKATIEGLKQIIAETV